MLNEPLATQLNIQRGDTILVRVQKPSLLSRDAPISPKQDTYVALRVTVRKILSDAEFGRFGLQANQVAPYSVFLSLAVLQERLELSGRANLLLAGDAAPEALAGRLKAAWTLADGELELRAVPETGAVELRTRRVFLDQPVVDAAKRLGLPTAGVLTYFVNELRHGLRMTPYSMVTGMGEPVAPAGMRDDEIILNSWLAEDLEAKPGDEIELAYYVMGSEQRLEERQDRFKVHSVTPIEGAAADRGLMPDFPGIAKAEKTENWDAGFPVKMSLIRPKDEQYWKDYRGTPKAFVTLSAAQRMWTNRFGNLTALRVSGNDGGALLERVGRGLRNEIDPAVLGLYFQPVRERALEASENGQDFGQLFLGFSFFVIVGALLFMGLLFQFRLEQRAKETGALLAMGFAPRLVRRLMIIEGGILAAIGGALGLLGGVGYAKLLLRGLTTLWKEAVGTTSLTYYASPVTLAAGWATAVGVGILTIWLVLRKQARQPARELLAGGGIEGGSEVSSAGTPRRGRSQTTSGRPAAAAPWVAWGTAAAAGALVAWALVTGQTTSAGVFFGAGALCLVSGLSFVWMWLHRLARAGGRNRLSLVQLEARGVGRRRTRSLATAALLGCGSFLVVAVAANKLDANLNADDRSSGTGGFALIAESSLPITADLNTSAGREELGLDATLLDGVSVLPLRVKAGDDASCLNLNRAQSPRLLGVRPELLASRHAFQFSSAAAGLDRNEGWKLLDLEDGVVPAIGDAASIQWAMGRKVGDEIEMKDENGQVFRVRLVAAIANSILQGSLLISEQEFLRRFPGANGYRMFLIDAPSNSAAQVAAELSRGLQDLGLEVTPTVTRLAAFNAVQNTYLNTFQVLGGVGLMLGTAGLGVVVMRNVLERRAELALLAAVGFEMRRIQGLVLGEHWMLLALGLGTGSLAAMVAVFPALTTPSSGFPVASVAATLAGVFALAMLGTWLSTRLALRGSLLESLRSE